MERRDSLRDGVPLVLLAAAVATSLALLLTYGSGLTFLEDDWSFLLARRGFNADAFFLPHNEHISILPVAVYKLLLAIFGMTSTAPFRVAATVAIAATAVLSFAYLRSRVGAWLALMASVLVLFLGPGWRDLLWPFQIGLIASLGAGIGMLVALDRRDRRGDRLACALLVVSTVSSSLGLSFILAALVDVLLRARSTDWRRRLAIPGIPLAIFAAWYAVYGHRATSAVSAHNVLQAPVYLFEGVAAALQSLLGLVPSLEPSHPTWGWAALGLLVAGLGLYIVLGGRPTARVAVPGIAAASFWLLAGADYIPGREATQSRYQLIAVVLLLLVLGEVFRGIRPRRAGLAVAGAVTVLALVANLATLRHGRDFLRSQTALSRSELAAVEIAHRTVSPFFTLTAAVARSPDLTPVSAGPYLAATREYGSPAYDERELLAAPEADRALADNVLGQALPVTLSLGGRPPRQGRCIRTGGANPPSDVAIGGETTTIAAEPGAAATIWLRRFASRDYALDAGTVPAGASALLEIPPDASARPWHLVVRSGAPATVCGAGLRPSRR